MIIDEKHLCRNTFLMFNRHYLFHKILSELKNVFTILKDSYLIIIIIIHPDVTVISIILLRLCDVSCYGLQRKNKVI